MTKEIPLTDGRLVLVDDADYTELSQWKWHATGTRRNYAARSDYSSGKRKTVLMHRWILQATSGEQVDHKNRNTLDNRRDNLRSATPQQNSANNAGKPSRRNSRFIGVLWRTDRRKWQAYVRQGKKTRYFGLFGDEVAAARARDRGVLQLRGEYAYLNFPDDHV